MRIKKKELLDALRNKPRAYLILHYLISSCCAKTAEVEVHQDKLGQKLGVHRDTIGRWVRYLEKNQYLVCLDFSQEARGKRYRIGEKS